MFRRKRKDEDRTADEAEVRDDSTDGDEPGGDDTVPRERPAPAATGGPYDEADVPDDDRARLDLGGLRVPVPEGVEIRVDVSPEGQVMAATAVHRGGQLQMNAFAAPRDTGIWADVRTEIAAALQEQGGSAEEVEGPAGMELRARIPGAQGGTQPARFVGADGPRWFVRGLITGPAATDAAQAAVLLDVFRNLVVVRGKDAMAPRDVLPLHLPKEAREQMAAQQEEGGERKPTQDDLDPFHRGPEITEVR